eukprot:355061-Chlamydomonas_euryale.AAC.8
MAYGNTINPTSSIRPSHNVDGSRSEDHRAASAGASPEVAVKNTGLHLLAISPCIHFLTPLYHHFMPFSSPAGGPVFISGGLEEKSASNHLAAAVPRRVRCLR